MKEGDYLDFLKTTKQASLTSFSETSGERDFVSDILLVKTKHKEAAILRELMSAILPVVNECPEGIMFEGLVHVLESRGYIGYDYPSWTMFKACKELIHRGKMEKKEWKERYYDGTNSYDVKVYQFFPKRSRAKASNSI